MTDYVQSSQCSSPSGLVVPELEHKTSTFYLVQCTETDQIKKILEKNHYNQLSSAKFNFFIKKRLSKN